VDGRSGQIAVFLCIAAEASMAGILSPDFGGFRLSRAVIILEAARMFESFTAKIRSTLLRISALRF
jgi:hypothetical protein